MVNAMNAVAPFGAYWQCVATNPHIGYEVLNGLNSTSQSRKNLKYFASESQAEKFLKERGLPLQVPAKNAGCRLVNDLFGFTVLGEL